MKRTHELQIRQLNGSIAHQDGAGTEIVNHLQGQSHE